MNKVLDWLKALVILMSIILILPSLPSPLGFQTTPSLITQNSQILEQIPTEIQGIWSYEGERINQEVILRGNQMIVKDDYNGTIYYSIDYLNVEVDFDYDQIEDSEFRVLYTLHTDLEDYRFRYGEAEAIMSSENYTFVYDASSDELIAQAQVHFQRNKMAEEALVLREDLINSQPVNMEQLHEISDEELINLFEEVKEEADPYQALYYKLIDQYAQLNLLLSSEYQAYFIVIEELQEIHDFELSRLNQANPRKILNLYNKHHGEISQELIMEIEDEIQAYHRRRLTFENSLKYRPQ